jgi:hypothetical protein
MLVDIHFVFGWHVSQNFDQWEDPNWVFVSCLFTCRIYLPNDLPVTDSPSANKG